MLLALRRVDLDDLLGVKNHHVAFGEHLKLELLSIVVENRSPPGHPARATRLQNHHAVVCPKYDRTQIPITQDGTAVNDYHAPKAKRRNSMRLTNLTSEHNRFLQRRINWVTFT